MNEFLFLYRGGMSSERQPSPEEMQQQMASWQSWMAKLAQDGVLKDVGAPLQAGGKKVAAGGVVTDGPYSEGKELIGGFSIVRARDINEAANIAGGCPVFNVGGTVEVRPLGSMA